MKLRTWAGIFLIGSLLLCFTGCSSAGDNLKGLGADIADIKVSDASATLTIRYVNEMLLPAGISSAKHRIYLNGELLAEATSPAPVGLPQLSAIPQDITLADAQTVARLRQLQGAGPQRYRIESKLYLLAGDEKLDTSSKAEGVIAVK